MSPSGHMGCTLGAHDKHAMGRGGGDVRGGQHARLREGVEPWARAVDREQSVFGCGADRSPGMVPIDVERLA
jgi:hypothetical protein